MYHNKLAYFVQQIKFITLTFGSVYLLPIFDKFVIAAMFFLVSAGLNDLIKTKRV